MKTNSLNKIIVTAIACSSILFSGLCYSYKTIYNDIGIDIVLKPVIEYGSKYKLEDYINEVDGKIVNIKSDISTDLIGKQQAFVVVEKHHIEKTVPVILEVKDTKYPVIKIDKKDVSIYTNNKYDILDNISVSDSVDGPINYLKSDLVKNNSVDYYTYTTDFNNKKTGTYKVKVKAVDKNGNVSTDSFDIKVKEKVVRREVLTNFTPRPETKDVVATAYSLLGRSYRRGANGPDSFDCSGFVQYVYKVHGIKVSRSASTQAYDGVAVSYSNAQPGDILNWGTSASHVTHSALYVGGGMMIHAANSSTGVILSDVAKWDRGSSDNLVGVRRIK